MSSWVLSIPKDRDYKPLCPTCSNVPLPLLFKIKKFYDVQMEFLVFKLVLTASYLSTEHHQEEYGSLIPSVYLHMLKRSIPEPSLLQAKQTQCSQLLLQAFQNLNHLCGLLLDSPQYAQVFLVLVSPEMDIVLQMRSHQHWVEGKDHLPQPAVNTLPN